MKMTRIDTIHSSTVLQYRSYITQGHIESTYLHISMFAKILQTCCFATGNVSLDTDLEGKTTQTQRYKINNVLVSPHKNENTWLNP